MRKIIVLTFITLDGIMQAPGGPDEDSTDSFPYGGWSFPFWDEGIDREMEKQMNREFELLLGRKTFDVFAGSWPTIDPDNSINKVTKYVVTSHPIPDDTIIWKNSIQITGNIEQEIRQLKTQEGPDLQVHGSSKLIQLLMENDLVDEFWLKIFPITLGTGKRLFGSGTIPKTFKVTECQCISSGVILVKYEKVGPIQQGSFM